MNNPFIKVTWEDTPENLTQERIKRVKTYFENKYNSTNVKIITKIALNDNETKLKSLDVTESITDYQYQKSLMKDFIDDNKMVVKWEMINRLDDKVNGELTKITTNKIRYNKWFIKKIEFSNFLSFGENNVINFDDLGGITVVESDPPNFGGKSTATVDLLLFLFFNSTTKSKTNIEVFNKFTDVDEVKVKGYVSVDSEDYVISRIVSRKKGRTGDYTVKNELEFSKYDTNGQYVNLSGEQRRETENIITSAIGTEEDFLSTILTTGYNLEDLIDSKPTARGQILTKFLGLEILKQKEEICKTLHSEWGKKLVSNTNNIVDLETKNKSHEDEITTSKEEIEKLKSDLGTTKTKLKEFEENKDNLLKKRNSDIDQELMKINPVTLKNEIETLKRQKVVTVETVESIPVVEPSSYYYEDKHEHIKKVISDYQFDLKVTRDDINKKEKLIKELEEGQICPTCKRSLEDVDHSDEINDLKNEIKDCQGHVNEIIDFMEIKVKHDEQLNLLKKEYDEYEKNKLRRARYELEADQKQFEIDTKQGKLEIFEGNKKKLDENQKIDGEITLLKVQIETLNGEIKQKNNFIERYENSILNLQEKITINLDLINKIKGEEEINLVFKAHLLIFGKNGISKVIIKNMIPLLNQELHRILLDSCYFTLELNINDKNELEFLMIDNETRIVKPLSSGSGYEKTISSLAIRSILTKISSLPKPNIIVMDEVFGKIADNNLDMVGEFFVKIKNYFEHIILISHNPLLKNWSDNVIRITKPENVSSIESITTKN